MRRLLNSDTETDTGFVVTSFKKEESSHYYVEAQVRIYDCVRSITLDFDCYDRADTVKRLAKINILIEELEIFRAKLEDAAKVPKFYY